MYKYISSKHTDPNYKAIRKQLADSYRLMRRDNKAIARLVYKINKRVERQICNSITNGIMNGGAVIDYPLDRIGLVSGILANDKS